ETTHRVREYVWRNFLVHRVHLTLARFAVLHFEEADRNPAVLRHSPPHHYRVIVEFAHHWIVWWNQFQIFVILAFLMRLVVIIMMVMVLLMIATFDASWL